LSFNLMIPLNHHHGHFWCQWLHKSASSEQDNQELGWKSSLCKKQDIVWSSSSTLSPLIYQVNICNTIPTIFRVQKPQKNCAKAKPK
jgi:hypothetical protein